MRVNVALRVKVRDGAQPVAKTRNPRIFSQSLPMKGAAEAVDWETEELDGSMKFGAIVRVGLAARPMAADVSRQRQTEADTHLSEADTHLSGSRVATSRGGSPDEPTACS